MGKQTQGFDLVDSIVGLFKKLGTFKFKSIFRATVVCSILIIFGFLTRIVLSQELTNNLINHWINGHTNEIERLTIRENVSPKIQKNLIELATILDADRAVIIEGHNGKENMANMPFKYWDMTYEETSIIHRSVNVSSAYSNVMTTHYKLPYYLSSNKFFIGNTEELRKIDNRFANNMEDGGSYYIGIIAIRSNGINIGFLAVAYDVHSDSKVPSKELILKKLEEREKVIAPLLDLTIQEMELKNN